MVWKMGIRTAPAISDITQLDVPSDNGSTPSGDALVHQTNIDFHRLMKPYLRGVPLVTVQVPYQIQIHG